MSHHNPNGSCSGLLKNNGSKLCVKCLGCSGTSVLNAPGSGPPLKEKSFNRKWECLSKKTRSQPASFLGGTLDKLTDLVGTLTPPCVLLGCPVFGGISVLCNGFFPASRHQTGFLFQQALSMLLRTVHSVLKRTPPELLTEIIMVNDNSPNEDLQEPLETYVRYLPAKVSFPTTR